MIHPRIGIFDSGIGGLTLARSLTGLLPPEGFIYVADNARAPYGPQSRAAIRAYSFEVTRFLLKEGARLIVVACNTATSAAITPLRAAFPEVPFVGMEPAVKPAAIASRNGHIGVMATELTLQGDRFADLVHRYAPAANLYTDPCRGLVPLIESGNWEGPAVQRKLQDILQPMLRNDIDTLVLGCTHYPLLRPAIEAICGPGVELIDPAPATARQVVRLLERFPTRASATAEPLYRFYATGSSIALETALARLGWGHRLLVPGLRLTGEIA